jgi:hypothetical protein
VRSTNTVLIMSGILNMTARFNLGFNTFSKHEESSIFIFSSKAICYVPNFGKKFARIACSKWSWRFRHGSFQQDVLGKRHVSVLLVYDVFPMG